MGIEKILLVEDDDLDAELIMAAAGREGMSVDWLRADDEESFLNCIERSPDIVITDFNLPSFSALRLLDLVRERGFKVPVLVVTGAIDDELAAECVKHGAADYLLKDRLARLRDALEGAYSRFRAERQKKEAERQLLAAASSRAVLNDMLLRSLSVDLSESSLRAVFAPLFEDEAPRGLVSLLVELPGLPAFELHVRGLGPDKAGSARRIERGLDLGGGEKLKGRLAFDFDGVSGPDRGTEQFLDEVAYVVSGVVKRARAEQSLRRSLAEQEELLREIHHRVKNNLAAVQSLVSLEAARLGDGPGREALSGLESQVRSMALVHEMLYSRESFTGIDFEEYLRELKIRLADGMDCDQDSILLAADCRGLCIPLEAAVTLGILFNDLFLHAIRRVSAIGPVELRIDATEIKDKVWELRYRERPLPGRVPGAMLSEGEPFQASDLEFITMLLPQYNGRIGIDRDELCVRLSVQGAPPPQVATDGA